jgi:hypothetical protein
MLIYVTMRKAIFFVIREAIIMSLISFVYCVVKRSHKPTVSTGYTDRALLITHVAVYY